MAIKLKKSRALSALSLTPLIDVVFLLLIFFLVTTRFAEEEREMDVILPEASEAVPLVVQPSHLFINVDEQGRFFLGGEELDRSQLQQALRQAWANNPEQQEVVIRGDKHSHWEAIAQVMNMCNKANIRNYKTAIAD
jgi:biopolymer transport protein ExbD